MHAYMHVAGVFGDLWETEGRRRDRHTTRGRRTNADVGEVGQMHDKQHVLLIKCGLINSRSHWGFVGNGGQQEGQTHDERQVLDYDLDHACLYVCVYTCMHVCMYACIHVYMHVCMYACMYIVHMHVCLYV